MPTLMQTFFFQIAESLEGEYILSWFIFLWSFVEQELESIIIRQNLFFIERYFEMFYFSLWSSDSIKHFFGCFFLNNLLDAVLDILWTLF